MNLKTAFRYQNKLTRMLESCNNMLQNRENLMRTTETHLRSKVNKDDEDFVVVTDNAGKDFVENIDLLVSFATWLLAQKQALTTAIRAAKTSSELDIDGETAMNQMRQQLASALSYMSDLKSSSEKLPNRGSGVKFNADGEQTTYRCDMEVVSTINFNRNAVKSKLKELTKQASETSDAIDAALLTTKVDYDAPFDVEDSMLAVFTQFAENQATADSQS